MGQVEKENKISFATFRFVGSLMQFQNTANSFGSKSKIEKSLELATPIRLKEALSSIERKYDLQLPDHSLLILINGVESSVLGGLDAVIDDGDEVTIVPMFHGG